MKNLKKILLSLMVLFLAFAFIGCPAEPDPVTPITPEPETPEPETPEQETPVVTNNFNGKTFIGMTGEGEDAEFASYIIFTSDKDCEVMFFEEEPMPATYTVTDDVATLTGTGEYAELQLSTTKLTDGTFDITIPPAVSKEEKDIVVSYAVGTLWTILYDVPDSDEDFSLKMPEEELESAVDHFGFVEADYNKDDATKTVTLTASGWAKVQAAMGGDSDDEGGNTETPETPVVTNNFMGKTFLGMTGEGEDAYFASYIIFTSDKDCEVMFFDEEPMPATYTVADDVATLTGTGEYAALQISTTKLTDGTFEITIPPAVSQQEKDIVVSYAVGTLWTILYDIPDSDEDFSWKMPEEELEAAVENSGFVEADYTKDDATKTITLTASGFAKVQALMGGGSGGEDSGEVTDETWTVLGPDGRFIRTFANLTEAQAFAEENELEPGVDFNMDSEAQTITLTAAGAEKLGMGGDTEGGDSGEVYYYYNGEPIGGKNTLEDFQYDDVKMYDLVEGTDYNIDHKNKYINFTDSGVEKLGIGSDDETWTVLDPEGNPLETFESLEAAGAFATENGLDSGVDYTLDEEKHIIYLLAKEG